MPEMFSQTFSLEQQKHLASNITSVLSIYGYITDSYIIEFFTNGLWEKLPGSWQAVLQDIPSPMLAELLFEKKKTEGISYMSVWPLSLLALKATAHVLTYPRTPQHNRCEVSSGRLEEFPENHCQDSMLKTIFRKHVKPKKQYEIRQLGKMVKKLSDVTGCEHVVDIGSGQGHFSRFLSFGLGLPITAVEVDQHLVSTAAKIDQELINTLQKERDRTTQNPTPESTDCITLRAPRHVLGWVNPRASWEEFMCLFQSCNTLSSGTCFSKMAEMDCCQRDDGVREDNFQVRSSTMAKRVHSRPSTEREVIKTAGNSCAENTAAIHSHSNIKAEGQRCSRSVEVSGHTFDIPSTNILLENNPFQKITGRGADFIAEGGRSCDCCATHKPPGISPVNTLSSHGFSPNSRIILTGLHACGDLSVAMLRHFARCPNVVGITSVACCYMKITTKEMPLPPGVLLPPLPPGTIQPAEFGYPMSTWVAQLPGHKLSYKSREVSCHAIEDYCRRLKIESTTLDSHCFRAVLETIIQGINPTMKRLGVQTTKKAHELSFEEYARLGLKRLGLCTNVPLDGASVKSMLAQRQNVVAYFSLALLLAPLVETLILLDRMIYLHEYGFQCELVPLFDPKLSPRNLVVVAAKPKLDSA